MTTDPRAAPRSLGRDARAATLERALARVVCLLNHVDASEGGRLLAGRSIDAINRQLIALALQVAIAGLLPRTRLADAEGGGWSQLRARLDAARRALVTARAAGASLLAPDRAELFSRAALSRDDAAAQQLQEVVARLVSGPLELGALYERLLARTIARADTPTLELAGARGRAVPVSLDALDRAAEQGAPALLRMLRARTGRGGETLRRALARGLTRSSWASLARACRGDADVLARLRPYASLAADRTCPVVHLPGALYLREHDGRRASGSHYTPPALADELVTGALEPLVYRGPAEGAPRTVWTLRDPEELLSLRVCDPAMGAGALLLRVCRYLAARVAEARGRPGGEHEVAARREVAARCLYGVDLDETAVALARVAVWLEVQLPNSEEADLRAPLDRRLRAGDSLIGATRAGDIVDSSRAQVGVDWPREFPDVFDGDPGGPAPARVGFDALITNPPFVGGQRITGALGRDYREQLVRHVAHGARGSADLCAYFLLRACALARRGGRVGIIATNTIAQGDTREVGLDQLVARGLSITGAVRGRSWRAQALSGAGARAANVEVALLWMTKGTWRGEHVLDGERVPAISSALEVPGAVQGRPRRLPRNARASYQGSNILGLGFTLPPAEARALIEAAPRRAAVLKPYLNGRDLNRDPEQRASRWVIDFGGWPLRREDAPPGYKGPVAADYPELLARVRARVRPARARNRRRSRRERWWQYAERAPELYARLSGLARVLVKSEVGDPLSFAFVPNGWVYSHMLVVFPTDRYGVFAALQSSLHEAWARRYASSMRADLRYTPSDCFATFALPEDAPLRALAAIGRRYARRRGELTRARGEGLTRLYKRLHDPGERAAELAELRALQVALDVEVARAYGWDALALEHGFHPSARGPRFTMSKRACREVLDRLLALNLARADQSASSSASAQARATVGVSSCSVA